MQGDKDYYEILGASEKAEEAELKRAYRKLALKYHPDRNSNNKKEAEERFKEVAEAYYVLGDSKRREEYDAFRSGGSFAGGSFRGAQGFDFDEMLRGFSSGGRSGRYSTSGSMHDIFGDLFGSSSGSGFGSSRGEAFMSEPGAVDTDLKARISISKRRAQGGGEVRVQTPQGGRLAVAIPKGIKDGKRLRLTRQGKICPHCGKNGDLYLTVRVESESGGRSK